MILGGVLVVLVAGLSAAVAAIALAFLEWWQQR